jgi:hypothetical protein
MTDKKITEFFRTEVYKAHPEYGIELVTIANSMNTYLVVRLDGDYCYCFLLIFVSVSEDIKLVKPSQDQLVEFMRNDFSSYCVLKKVYVLQIDGDEIIDRRVFQPDYD